MTPATVDIDLKATHGHATAKLRESRAGVSGGRLAAPIFIPRDEQFFWTREWQEGEKESAAEREAGQLRIFKDGKGLLEWLDADED